MRSYDADYAGWAEDTARAILDVAQREWRGWECENDGLYDRRGKEISLERSKELPIRTRAVR